MATIVEGIPRAPFSIARGGRYSFPGLLYFTLDPYLIMLSVKQGGIKYHFLSLWYDSTWDWTQVSRAIGEHFNLKLFNCVQKNELRLTENFIKNVLINFIYIYIYILPNIYITQKMVLDASLLNTQHYKVCFKGKVEQSRERSSALPYTLV